MDTPVSDIIFIPPPNIDSKLPIGSSALETSGVKGQDVSSRQLVITNLMNHLLAQRMFPVATDCSPLYPQCP